MALALSIVGSGEVLVPFSSRTGSGSAVWSTAGVLAVAVSLLWCRRRPLVPLAAFPLIQVTTHVLPGSTYLLFYGQFLPFLLTLFLAVRHVARRRLPWALATGAVTLLLGDLFVAELRDPGELVFHWTIALLVGAAALTLRRWEQRTAQSTRRAVAAEVAAAEAAMRAVAEERARIARELHDIVAHSVTSIIVQAGAAEQAGPEDGDFVRNALAQIRGSGTEALAEMRRLVAVLRTSDEPVDHEPQPRLAALPTLVDRSGVPATLTVTGAVRPLPAGLDLAAYRIVQESLTNVRRHADATACGVRIDYGTDVLCVEVRDDGSTPAAPIGAGAPGGHGLVGMRERARLYGGTLEAGPAAGGGFLVRATLPLSS
jgi:signal transduction histidine kinase